MKALSDPRQPAEVGAVLQEFFGGTLLHWLLVFSLLALLSMRTVAEERQNGMWEAMLTTRASASSILLAKWLALVSFYVFLWLPTLLLILVFTWFLPPQQSLDLGPVASAYLAVIAIGSALAAIGVAVSSTTKNQVVAGVLSLVLFLAWLMAGEFAGLGAGESESHWLIFVNLREMMNRFASGEVDLALLLATSLVTAVALLAASGLVGQNRDSRRRYRMACLALLVGGASASSLAGKHWKSLDWTKNSVHTLEANTRAVLAATEEPIDVILVRPSDEAFESVFGEVQRLVGKMANAQSLLGVREIDPVSSPENIGTWAFDLGIQSKDLSSGGAVIFAQSNRRRVVDFMAMASYRIDDLGVGTLSEFRAEAAFAQAIADVSQHHRDKVCVAKGHGEFGYDFSESGGNREDWSWAAKRLKSEGVELVTMETIEPKGLAECDSLIVFGPDKEFQAEELQALENYLREGGNAFFALRALPALGDSELPVTGLSLLLENVGMEVLPAVVVDPSAAIETPPEWMTYEGYGEHAIVRDFQERRPTIWLPPRGLKAHGDEVVSLVRGSSESWAERNLVQYFGEGRYSQSEEESGDVSIALARENEKAGRIVLFGSAESLSDHWRLLRVGGNERLLIASCLWTLHRDMRLRMPSKGIEHLHLVMTQKQLREAFVYLVLVGPALFALFGALCWWWRRREK